MEDRPYHGGDAGGRQFPIGVDLRLVGSADAARHMVRHPRLPRFEALKILRADVSEDPDYQQRFNREADLAPGSGIPTSWRCATVVSSRASCGSRWTMSMGLTSVR
jgi:hypothetical protein